MFIYAYAEDPQPLAPQILGHPTPEQREKRLQEGLDEFKAEPKKVVINDPGDSDSEERKHQYF